MTDIIYDNPTTVLDSIPTRKIGDTARYRHATYGWWRLKYVQFLNLAGNKDQTCDAHFYAGVKKVIATDKAGAKAHFKKAIDSGASASNEYWSAMAEFEGVDKEK